MDNLTKVFGNQRAVDSLSFTVEPGSVTGFLGPNGAGKTTTLRMLLGLVRPTSGTATINGVTLRVAAPAAADGRRGAGGGQLPPGSHRPAAPADLLRRRRPARSAGPTRCWSWSA